MSRLCLYFKKQPEPPRWFPGDHVLRSLVKRLMGRKDHYDGVERSFINLCIGLEAIKMPYHVNLPFHELMPNDYVAFLGRGRTCLEGYNRSIPIVAGLGVMDHPGEWPDFCQQYPVKNYLQASKWAADICKPYFGADKVAVWPVGIPTDFWTPSPDVEKDIDLLIYDKVRWDRDNNDEPRADFIEKLAHSRNLRVAVIRYGTYTEEEYRNLLSRTRGMVFLCEHESQGLAYLEALSCDIPVLAWDHGYCLSPGHLKFHESNPPRATSVPYFDNSCGLTFRSLEDIEDAFDEFWSSVITSDYTPREYILDHLTIERCAGEFLKFFQT